MSDDQKRFGRLAVARGLLDEEQLADALSRQADLAAGGTHRPIGRILVDMGFLTLADVRALLTAQGLVVARCPDCGRGFSMRPVYWSPDRTCPTCRTPLSVEGESDPLTLEMVLPLNPDGLPLPAAPEPPSSAGGLPGETEADLAGGTRIGGCEIESLLGRGGMGQVYRGRHLTLHKPVAVKILATPAGATAQQIERFLLEARSAARLDHPNIVGVFDTGFEEGRHFIVMQFVEGEALTDVLRRKGKLTPGPLLRVARQVARGLAAAHEISIIHRDIKPGNIMIGTDGIARVADFGLAKDLGSDAGLSRAGQVVGSPYYMSPEQAEGRILDHRTDIYSLGVTLYHCLTGRLPFQAETPLGVLVKHIKEPAPPLREVAPEVPAPVASLVERMMAKNPAERFPDCETVAREIDAILDGTLPTITVPVQPRRRWPIPLAALALALLTAGIVILILHGRDRADMAEARQALTRARELASADRLDFDGAQALLTDASRRARTAGARSLLEAEMIVCEAARRRTEEVLLNAAMRDADHLAASGLFDQAVRTFQERTQPLRGDALARAHAYLDRLYQRRLSALKKPSSAWIESFEQAKKAWEELDRPARNEAVAEVRALFERIREAHPDGADRIDLELARMALSQEREARAALTLLRPKVERLERAGEPWEGADVYSTEFLPFFDGTRTAGEVRQEMQRLRQAGPVEPSPSPEKDTFFASADDFARSHGRDPAAVLARYRSLSKQARGLGLTDDLARRIARWKAEVDRSASEMLETARRKSGALEEAGRLLDALRIFELFPRPYLSNSVRPDLENEKARVRSLILDEIRAPLGLLGTTPASVARALSALATLEKRYKGTPWEKEVRRRRQEVEKEALVMFEKLRQAGEDRFQRGDVAGALALLDTADRFGLPSVDKMKRALYDRWMSRGALARMRSLIRKGRFADAAVLGQKTLAAVETSRTLKRTVTALAGHAERLGEGMVHVDGGALVWRGKARDFDAFYVDRFEVTNTQYKAFMIAGGYGEKRFWPGKAAEILRRALAGSTPWPRHWRKGRLPAGLALHPVRNISWFEARAWCLWKGRDLPTELQWAVAAGWERSTGRLRRFPWGERYDSALVYAGRDHRHPRTVAVNTYPGGKGPNGLYHAAGNVFEWVLAWRDPRRRIFRLRKGGDSADALPEEMTTLLHQAWGPPDLPHPTTGFRSFAPAPTLKELGME